MGALLAVFVYVISIIVLSIIFGEIRFRYKEKKLNEQKNEEQANKEANNDGGFHRSDYRVSKNCCNSDSYGVICVKCGRCGRKF